MAWIDRLAVVAAVLTAVMAAPTSAQAQNSACVDAAIVELDDFVSQADTIAEAVLARCGGAKFLSLASVLDDPVAKAMVGSLKRPIVIRVLQYRAAAARQR